MATFKNMDKTDQWFFSMLLIVCMGSFFVGGLIGFAATLEPIYLLLPLYVTMKVYEAQRGGG